MKISATEMATRRTEMLETAFRLFTEKNIDSVTMGQIAEETDYTLRSLHRYFHTKAMLVVAVATWAWNGFTAEKRGRLGDAERERMTGAQEYEFFLDSFLELYREHKDLLRFNQMFNVYVRAEQIDTEQMQPYRDLIETLGERFAEVYRKGAADGTLRDDVTEVEIFSASLHLMLAVVTRYAVGLVYDAGIDPERELLLQKELLMRQYTTV